MSDAILKLVHSRELWVCKAEDYLGTVTKTCVGRDPALTSMSDNKVTPCPSNKCEHSQR